MPGGTGLCCSHCDAVVLPAVFDIFAAEPVRLWRPRLRAIPATLAHAWEQLQTSPRQDCLTSFQPFSPSSPILQTK